LQQFIDSIETVAERLGIEKPLFRVTANLDGLVAKDSNSQLITRGDGRKGTEASFVFSLGAQSIGGRNRGLGKLVVGRSYFKEHFRGQDAQYHRLENPALGPALLVQKRDQCPVIVLQALQDQQIYFVPDDTLPSWQGSGKALMEQRKEIQAEFIKTLDYPLKGLMVEAVASQIREELAATNRFHRWKAEVTIVDHTAQCIVEKVTWSMGRTGKLVPKIHLQPSEINDRSFDVVMTENAAVIQKQRLGAGAVIRILHQGGVVPILDSVIAPAPLEQVSIPSTCPSCNSAVVWDNEDLLCINPHPEMSQQFKMVMFFRQLDVRGFRPS